MVEGSLMVRWAIGSIPYGGPIELFLTPASAAQLVYQRLLHVLSWDGAYKRTLGAD